MTLVAAFRVSRFSDTLTPTPLRSRGTNTIDYEPTRACIYAHGGKAQHVHANLEQLLDVLEGADAFAPLKWGRIGRGGLPFDRGEILQWVTDGTAMRQVSVHLKRHKVPRYVSDIALDGRPSFSMDAQPMFAAKYHAEFFELAEAIANALEPDVLVATLWPPMESPWTSERARDTEWLACAGTLPRVSYSREGPSGLAMRTIFGPHYLKQFGDQLLDFLLLEVKDLPWGGKRFDLVHEPWNAGLGELLTAFHAGMKTLEPAHVFAIPEFKNVRGSTHIKFTKNTGCKIEGPLRE